MEEIENGPGPERGHGPGDDGFCRMSDLPPAECAGCRGIGDFTAPRVGDKLWWSDL